MGYKEAVDYLYSLQKYGIKLGLDNTLSLMGILGNPHRRFKSIHIAGTNGKGSTAAMIASILKGSGLKVGLYTSPHLVSFKERIRVNGMPIEEERVSEMTLNLESQISNLKCITPTFFEFTTAIAFKYFAEEDVDIAVIEVGMGGRLDATNVITPLVSVITNIGYDHQVFLGTTLADIAGEKAGIIKEGIPVVMAENQTEVTEIIENKCKNMGSDLYIYGKDFRAEGSRLKTPMGRIQESRIKTQAFDYYGMGKVFRGIAIPLLGAHQIANASLSIAATEIISSKTFIPLTHTSPPWGEEKGEGRFTANEIKIEERAIRKGLKDVKWDARLEIISRNPTVILDGAHNEEAARSLKKSLEDIFLPEHERFFLIVGMMKDKDIRGFLRVLAPIASEVIVTAVDYERAASPESLAVEAEAFNPNVKAIKGVNEAIEYAMGKAGSRDLICITGSLYTVGEVKGFGMDVERLRV
jgi:dihydrofolate synthase/folylpolyglutamate synthase